ncbi:hypothetical protein ROHU_029376 [Labeo rohita]|uniref:Uncharacterized protein n=1 Tax=Labeo rohita TaxID=84645 RepID=A0A498LZE8_LABRO|nr:hypothetical protein ROHU_029376 [Labeo rohita]
MQMFSVAYWEIAPVGRKAQQGCARTVLPGERKPVEEGTEAPACSQPTQESYLSCSLCCCLKPHQTLGLGHSAHTYIQIDVKRKVFAFNDNCFASVGSKPLSFQAL